jgi:multidrug efflux pump subunit AcrB
MTLQQNALRFAPVALLLAAGASLGQTTPEGKPGPAKPRPVIAVEASYPGANAQELADTVAAPIEHQVDGVEGMEGMSSRSANDGTYTLLVTFRRGVDAGRARVLVQNRVNLALPALPDVVKRSGVTVKERPAGVLLFVKVFSPDRSRDHRWLSNLDDFLLREPLSGLPGVAEVTALGKRDDVIRIWLDREKLASHNLKPGDVVEALQGQNLQAAGGPKAKAGATDEPIRLHTLGRLPDLAALEGLILKATPEGRVVYLKDVARCRMAAGPRASDAFVKGEAVVLLGVYLTPQARPREVSAAVTKQLAKLRERLPEGGGVEVAFDFAANLEASDREKAPEYLLLDLALPVSASKQRVVAVLKQCQATLRDVKGVQDTLALTDNPFDRSVGRPCILVRLTPPGQRKSSRGETTRAIRTRLGEIQEMALRVRGLSGPDGFPQCGYPLDLAVSGPETDRVREFATKLAKRLRQSKKLADVWANPDSMPIPHVYVDIDRDAAARMGVSLRDVFNTLNTYLGSGHVNDFDRFGRTWQVVVQGDPRFREKAEEIRKLQVRNSKGDMVPLAALLKVREFQAPRVLDRLNLRPAVKITANPAPGTSLAEARKRCDTFAEEVRRELRLPAEYRLTWLQELAAPR